MLPLKGCERAGLVALGDDAGRAASAPVNSTLARVVSKWVLLGTTSPCLQHDGEENALGGAALVGGDDVLVAEDVLHGISEADEAAAAGVALIALHNGGPLVGGHGAGAGVGEQIDQHIVGGEQEQVVVGGAQESARDRRAGSSGWAQRS